jgi:hypothetical protein
MKKVCIPQQAQNLIVNQNTDGPIRHSSFDIRPFDRPASNRFGVAQGSPASDHVPQISGSDSPPTLDAAPSDRPSPPIQESTNPSIHSAPARSALSTLDARPSTPPYRLRRGLGFWQLTFMGQDAVLKHEQGLAYIAWLLLNPPEEPIHAVALALNARKMCGEPVDPAELIQQRSLGLDDAESLRFLRQHEEKLQAIIDDEDQIDPVKEEAISELKEIYEFQNKNSWSTRDNAQRCVRAVTMAIKRFHKNLAQATTLHRRPDLAVRAFADHIYHHIMVPSGRAGNHGGARRWLRIPGGCFTYDPPSGVHWTP